MVDVDSSPATKMEDAVAELASAGRSKRRVWKNFAVAEASEGAAAKESAGAVPKVKYIYGWSFDLDRAFRKVLGSTDAPEMALAEPPPEDADPLAPYVATFLDGSKADVAMITNKDARSRMAASSGAAQKASDVLWSGVQKMTGHGIELRQIADHNMIAVLYNQSHKVTSIDIQQFADAPLPRDDKNAPTPLAHDHSAVRTMLELMTPLLLKYCEMKLDDTSFKKERTRVTSEWKKANKPKKGTAKAASGAAVEPKAPAPKATKPAKAAAASTSSRSRSPLSTRVFDEPHADVAAAKPERKDSVYGVHFSFSKNIFIKIFSNKFNVSEHELI